MNEELLTLKEISRRLQVPESSIRYYRDRFLDYLPARGQGRKRRYKRQALDIFRTIVQGYKNDRNAEEIKSLLQQQLQGSPQQAESQSPRVSTAVQTFAAASKTPQDILQSQAQTLSSLANLLVKKSRLEEEVHHLREEHRKIKKGLLLLWKKYKQQERDASQAEEQTSIYQDIEERLYELHNELASLWGRQKEHEQKQEREMQELRQQVEKCQFWTKRLMLCSKQEIQEEDSS